MTAPDGKGIYTQAPGAYPGDSPADYAAGLGCSFICLLRERARPEDARRAKELGLRVFVWSPPGEWLPSTWRRGLYQLAQTAEMLGADGIIADAENAPVWRDREEDLEALGRGLYDATGYFSSVGFTSFPTWPHWKTIARLGKGRVWGSPQAYGVREGGVPASTLQRWARSWRGPTGFREVRPSIPLFSPGPQPAGAYGAPEGWWDRSAEDQYRVLRAFDEEKGTIFWHVQPLPQPGSPIWDAARGFAPSPVQLWQIALATGLSVTAAAGLWYALRTRR